MAWPDLTDLANRTVLAVYAEPAVYQPIGGAPVSLRVAFSETFVGVLPDTGVSVTSSQPNALLRLAELGLEVKAGDRLTCRGELFAVEEPPQVDGTGTVLLMLKRCTP